MRRKKIVHIIGVGMPEWLWLNEFGRMVNDAFGSYPYLVGSAAKSKIWRDVDIRLILTDGEYKSLIGKVGQDNARWRVFNMAFSELGKRITGLPVDFQIQQQTDANKQFHDLRDALILSDMDERK